jgi:tRNA threonylcarbamoyladenosine biosynthesis protein TsaE
MPETVKSQSFQLDDLGRIAEELLNDAGNCRVWLFSGELGAGKTTLIKAVCTALDVRSHMTSPTFSIVNVYHTSNNEPVYHFDFYRLKDENEALDVGVDEYLDSGNYCFIEWPDRIPSLIPSPHFKIHMVIVDKEKRRLEAHLHD